MAFNREAFVRMLADYCLIHGLTEAGFAKKAGISPGALSDITKVDPDTGRPRRQPSTQMIGKLQRGLELESIGALVGADHAEAAAS